MAPAILRGWMQLEFPYNATVIAALKDNSNVASAARRWDGKNWLVRDDFAPEVIEIMTAAFDVVEIDPGIKEHAEKIKAHEEGLDGEGWDDD